MPIEFLDEIGTFLGHEFEDTAECGSTAVFNAETHWILVFGADQVIQFIESRCRK